MIKGLGSLTPQRSASMEQTGYKHAGHIDSSIPGRTDELPMTVENGAYVIPADIVSALGEGNTAAGAEKLARRFGQPRPRYAQGGVPIIAAGGEWVVPPEKVRELGGGDMDRGHDILDAFVKQVRKDTIRTLKKLKGPKT